MKKLNNTESRLKKALLIKKACISSIRGEVFSERCNIVDKSYEKFNILVEIDPRPRGMK